MSDDRALQDWHRVEAFLRVGFTRYGITILALLLADKWLRSGSALLAYAAEAAILWIHFARLNRADARGTGPAAPAIASAPAWTTPSQRWWAVVMAALLVACLVAWWNGWGVNTF